MGQGFGEVSAEAKEFLTNCKGDNNTPRVDIDGRLYSAQELSANTPKKKKTALLGQNSY
jgi:molecular chaperone DnaK